VLQAQRLQRSHPDLVLAGRRSAFSADSLNC
jgi:hypothetical protein